MEEDQNLLILIMSKVIKTKLIVEMFNKDGTPRFKYIVEGANLFITESARHILEDRGVLLFKDASTNKGNHLDNTRGCNIQQSRSLGQFMLK